MALPTYVGITNYAANAYPGSISWVAGHAADDIGVLVVVTDGTTPTTPSGFSIIPNTSFNVSGNARTICYWKRATSGAESAVSIAGLGSPDGYLCSLVVIRGCPTASDPFNTTAGQTQSSQDPITYPSITTTKSDCFIILFGTNGRDIATNTAQFSTVTNGNLANITERRDYTSSNGTGLGYCVVTAERAVAANIGTTTQDISTADDGSIAVIMALESIDSVGSSSYSKGKLTGGGII